MVLFGDLRNNIPLIDFASVLEETLIIYCTTPHSLLNHFHLIDDRIVSNSQTIDLFVLTDSYFTLTPNEFVTICSTDLKNILIVDVCIMID